MSKTVVLHNIFLKTGFCTRFPSSLMLCSLSLSSKNPSNTSIPLWYTEPSAARPNGPSVSHPSECTCFVRYTCPNVTVRRGREKKLGHCWKSQKDELNTQRRLQALRVHQICSKKGGRREKNHTTRRHQRNDKAKRTKQVLHIWWRIGRKNNW